MKSEQINWYEVLRRLQAVATAAKVSGPSRATTEMDGLADWLAEGVEQDNHMKSFHARLDSIGRDLASGAVAPPALMELMSEVRQSVPDFRVVVLDETKHWSEPVREAAGRIYGAYLFDTRRQVHLAEIKPSCELHYLYSTAANDVAEDVQEALLAEVPDPRYVYSDAMLKIGLDQVHICGEPNDLSAETYDELVGSMIEECRANVRIQLPRAVQPEEGIRFARRLLAVEDRKGAERIIGEMPGDVSAIIRENAREGGDLVKGLDVALRYLGVKKNEGLMDVQQAVEPVRLDASKTDEVGEILRQAGWTDRGDAQWTGLRAALPQLQAALAPQARKVRSVAQGRDEDERLAGADAAALFFREVLEIHGTLNVVDQRYGSDAVAMVSYMQAALLRNSGVDAWPMASSFVEVVEALPSSDRWLKTMTFFNKYGEQVPREAFQPFQKTASAQADASPAP